jgi:hypothetical protein
MIHSGKHPLASGDLALLNTSEPNWAGNAKLPSMSCMPFSKDLKNFSKKKGTPKRLFNRASRLSPEAALRALSNRS